MSAPGIQLGSGAQLAYFEPTVRQYLQQLIEAVTTQNLTTAGQALARLEEAVHASGSSVQILSDLQRVSAALHSGDLSAAGQAVDQLQQHFSAVPARRSDAEGNPTAPALSSGPTGTEVRAEDSRSESTGQLDLRV